MYGEGYTRAVAVERRSVLERVYAALGAGDRDALLALLAPDFDAEFAAGMPAGGGHHAGAEAAIENGWWAIGRAFAARAEPEEWIECADNRLLVRGRYRGKARSTGQPLDAAFDHLWTVQNGRVTSLQQLTDTALWINALAEES
jgi:ketosteroid isomerase-like protein